MGQQGLLEANPDFFLIIVFIRQTGAFVFRVYMSLTPASGWYLHAVKLSFYFFVLVENLVIFITTYQSVKEVWAFFFNYEIIILDSGGDHPESSIFGFLQKCQLVSLLLMSCFGSEGGVLVKRKATDVKNWVFTFLGHIQATYSCYHYESRVKWTLLNKGIFKTFYTTKVILII